jgi:hypothetical protein
MAHRLDAAHHLPGRQLFGPPLEYRLAASHHPLVQLGNNHPRHQNADTQERTDRRYPSHLALTSVLSHPPQ